MRWDSSDPPGGSLRSQQGLDLSVEVEVNARLVSPSPDCSCTEAEIALELTMIPCRNGHKGRERECIVHLAVQQLSRA